MRTIYKVYIGLLLILAIGLAWIGGWLVNANSQSRAAADQYAQWAQSQKISPIDFVISVPPETPVDQTLYVAGNADVLGNWDAAGVPMHRDSDGQYRATVSLMTGLPYKFKITRGTWGTVERGAAGVDIQDHTFVADAGTPINSTVLTWVDGGKSNPGAVTLTGIFRLHKKFESKLLGNFRTIIVYLPPDYESNTTQRYPVLYLQDGQNLFDASTAFAGIEWRVDETAQDLIQTGKINPVIIVGIYNTADRTAEFTPFEQTPAGLPGKAGLYGRFIVEELKPMIDSAYRTLPGKDSTSIGGSSLGGMVTLSVARDHPGVFGGVVLLDPWLRDSKQSLLDTWTDDSWMKGIRFYVDMGTAGGAQYPGDNEVQDFNAFVARLNAAGLKPGTDYVSALIPNAQHNESAWQKRVGDFLTFLHGK